MNKLQIFKGKYYERTNAIIYRCENRGRTDRIIEKNEGVIEWKDLK